MRIENYDDIVRKKSKSIYFLLLIDDGNVKIDKR